jgi:hypothetical protein
MKKKQKSKSVGNFANCDDLHKCSVAIGPKYNRFNASIKLKALAKLRAAMAEMDNATNNAETDQDLHVNPRKAACSTIKPLAKRLINALSATKVLPHTGSNMRSMVYKVRGKGIKPMVNPTSLPDNPNAKAITHSVSQQSFIRLTDHLKEMAALLNIIPEYQLNTEDMKITAKAVLVDELRTKNSVVSNSETKLDNANLMRTSLLYAPGTDLVDIARDVKHYVESIDLTRYTGVPSLPFKNISSK